VAGPRRDTIEGVSLPPREAIEFFRQKVNVPTERWTDVWQEAHSRSFMVAGAATQALVQDFRDAVQQALEQGTTLADFRKGFDEIVGRTGWEYNGPRNWRTRIIFETNLSTAYSAGRYAQMVEPATLEAFPYWRYVHSGARNPREQHKRWNGTTLRADDPFWRTHYPPNGWRCGCRVEPMSARDVSRGGRPQVDQAPPVETRRVPIGKTGRVEDVPVGIDPGFAYNPGEAWRGPPQIPGGAVLQPPPGWPPPVPGVGGVGGLEFEGLLRQAERRAGLWVGELPGSGQVAADPPPTRPRVILDGEAEPVRLGRGRAMTAEGEVRRALPPPMRGRGATVPEFARWARAAGGAAELSPRPIPVGSIGSDLIRQLGERGDAPSPRGRAIVMTADKYRRIAGKDVRVKKPGGVGVAIAEEDLVRMPQILAEPLAVLRQKDNGNLVYAFRSSRADEERLGKLVVAVDRTISLVGGVSGRRSKVTASQVISGGMVSRGSLLDPALFERLKGEL